MYSDKKQLIQHGEVLAVTPDLIA